MQVLNFVENNVKKSWVDVQALNISEKLGAK